MISKDPIVKIAMEILFDWASLNSGENLVSEEHLINPSMYLFIAANIQGD